MGSPFSSLGFRQLRLRQFRNFSELDQEFPPAGVAIIGENGAGKTNLLEAVYYLEIFRSFRGAPDEQLVHFGAETFHVRGRFAGATARPPDRQTASAHEVAAGFELRGRRKKVTRDGVEPERIGDAIGQVGAVIFSPSDIAIVRGSPAERRRFLDIVLSINRPGYLAALQRYRSVLRHRNAALRDARATAALHAWDEALVETGVIVMRARASWVGERSAAFTRRYTTIAGGGGGDLRYVSGAARRVDAGTLDDPALLREAFIAELARTADRERERGMTLAGPHRDDLRFGLENADASIDLRDFGSGGQVRTAAIALRMVEADTIREQRGRDPLILLDDVFAELDRPRSFRILELLETEQPGQVILTAPKESDLELRQGTLERWRIAAGQLES